MNSTSSLITTASATALLLVIAIAVASSWQAVFPKRVEVAPLIPKQPELNAAIDDCVIAFQNADSRQLSRLSTRAGSRQLNRVYDFNLATQGYEGTFKEFLVDNSLVIQQAKSSNTVTHYLHGDRIATIQFEGDGRAVTLGFYLELAGWRLAFFSPDSVYLEVVAQEIEHDAAGSQ